MMIAIVVLLTIIAVTLLAKFFPDFLVWLLQALGIIAALAAVFAFSVFIKSP